ncbi:MAG: YbaB/EbfC family nucleoid-associated protein [Puniceicoccaceae bacterium]|nr:MAG: YbaB/EbfC family nucleoid-associated protein [Puniceicoccaceae bacterium]
MAGVGKLLKQAQKMQKQIAEIQESLEQQRIDISSGGGAVQIAVNGHGHFLELKLDPEFLKEEVSLVEETLLEAIRDAAAKAKELNETEMQKATAGFQMPGLF